ncbi:MAG TPA: ethanolamine ammonia-lyase subunit EutC [Candidatus Avoscillospira avistercoris]|uniref:Ethanolamine ammonia-lyase small subunit n=1 Tax=Candidatus Avoscillospira avistercoris TaxID=2840707 RepID=A0A9D1JTU5_9FIRM|nr:ethanolamine ammonia-lyase subunit EutC [Candidatus Avoscillospira avistercoris]
MNKEELKAMVAQMLRDMGQNSGSTAPAPSAAPSHSDGAVDDLSKIDLRKQYLVENPANGPAFLALKAKTPARIGVGRAGARYKTVTLLRFRADHAAAQDSVFSQVPESFYKSNDLVYVKTKCEDKDEYLTRPDLGRRFDEQNQAIIKETCGPHPKVLLVIGDGLSSAAIEANAMDCARAIRQGLSAYGIELGKTLFIQYCRVGASDHIGSLTDAELVCMLVGERPGLVTAESMSAYLTYNPRIGVPESARTVVSNIHRQGTPAVEAGAHIASLIRQMLEKKCSGVAFRQGVGQ